MKIQVITVDGYSASIRSFRHRSRSYLSSVVKGYLSIMPKKSHVYFSHMRGFGMGRRKLRRLIRNGKGYGLLLCGKSYGVRLISRVLSDPDFLYSVRMKYPVIGLLTIDGHYPGRKGREIGMPVSNFAYNIYQENGGIEGAKIETKSTSFVEINLTDKHYGDRSLVNHWNIVGTGQVYAALESAVMRLLKWK